MDNIILYVVHAYRWGDREKHSYHVGVFDKEERAIEAAEYEQLERGGKYECEIYKTPINNDRREYKIVKALPR